MSLALFVGTAALWACAPLLASSRNYAIRTRPDMAQWSVGLSRSGWVRLSYGYPHPPGGSPYSGPIPNPLARASNDFVPLPGLRIERQLDPEQRADGTIVWHPQFTTTWLHLRWPLLLALVLPGWWAWGWHRARRRQRRLDPRLRLRPPRQP